MTDRRNDRTASLRQYGSAEDLAKQTFRYLEMGMEDEPHGSMVRLTDFRERAEEVQRALTSLLKDLSHAGKDPLFF